MRAFSNFPSYFLARYLDFLCFSTLFFNKRFLSFILSVLVVFFSSALAAQEKGKRGPADRERLQERKGNSSTQKKDTDDKSKIAEEGDIKGLAEEEGLEEKIDSLTDLSNTASEPKTGVEKKWYNPDYRDYRDSYSVINSIHPAYMQKHFNLALRSYQKSENVIKISQRKIQIINDKSGIWLEDRKYLIHEWRKEDHRSETKRKVRRVKYEAKKAASDQILRAISYLDKISQDKFRSTPDFEKFISLLYRKWVIYQYDLGNLRECIDMLERYLLIGENSEYEKEYPAHKYLAQAYAYQEKFLRNRSYISSPLAKVIDYSRQQKDIHLLRSAEILFGRDSEEYRNTLHQINYR